ncbi:hypothetical protein [Desulfosporosinus sp. FKA]|uniref:hypothetical protein n=1 Tax=Desulfosporosinus sp. FKA TaxID=1969834 RepID=UPI001124D0BD|nr:hypothetical protein [Desulfosporosinus sp. FKA]
MKKNSIRINDFFILTNGFISKNWIHQSITKNKKKELKNFKNNKRKRVFIEAGEDLFDKIPQNKVFKTKTHEKIVCALENKNNVKILRKKRNFFRLTLLLEKILLGNKEDLFKIEKFYKIKFVKTNESDTQ